MPGAARINTDTAGGTQLPPSQGFVFVEGNLWQILGGPVAPHGPGIHAGPVMATASSLTFINNIGVCREGDVATCGHASTGSGVVFSE